MGQTIQVPRIFTYLAIQTFFSVFFSFSQALLPIFFFNSITLTQVGPKIQFQRARLGASTNQGCCCQYLNVQVTRKNYKKTVTVFLRIFFFSSSIHTKKRCQKMTTILEKSHKLRLTKICSDKAFFGTLMQVLRSTNHLSKR